MTPRPTPPLTFSPIGSRRVEADFSAGVITTDAGTLLLREADRRLGLLDAFDQAIPDPRHPDLISHTQRSLLAQRVYGIASGYEDLNDHDTLRHDPLWQLLVEATPAPGETGTPGAPLASAPTLCRLENRIGHAALARLASVLVDQFVNSFTTPPESLILDFDATDDIIHGQQEGRFFHGYYDNYCFMPLYVFCGDQLLVAYLRTADGDGARHSRAILKLLVTRLRLAWPAVRLIVRGDGGFCRWRMMRWCDSQGGGYIFGLPGNSVLNRLALPWTETAAARQAATGLPQRHFGAFSYAAATWDRRRRVLVKAEHSARGANPRFIVSNLPGDPRMLYEEIYCARGGNGKPDQGPTTDVVRGSDELSSLRGESVPRPVECGGVCVGGRGCVGWVCAGQRWSRRR